MAKERDITMTKTNPLCDACGKEVENIYLDAKHTLCEECGDNHGYEGYEQ